MIHAELPVGVFGLQQCYDLLKHNLDIDGIAAQNGRYASRKHRPGACISAVVWPTSLEGEAVL